MQINLYQQNDPMEVKGIRGLDELHFVDEKFLGEKVIETLRILILTTCDDCAPSTLTLKLP